MTRAWHFPIIEPFSSMGFQPLRVPAIRYYLGINDKLKKKFNHGHFFQEFLSSVSLGNENEKH